MKLDFAVDYMNILESDEDTTLVELDLLHIGKNRNQYTIPKEAVEKALPTFYNKPIIYRLNNEIIPEYATDVVEHGTLEDRAMRIAGTIPESAPMEFVQRDGKEYLRTKGIIHKIYQPSLMNILQNRDGNVKVSIEIYVTDKEDDIDGSWIIKDFKLEGVALLGEDILEGIEGSQMNVLKFSAKDFNAHYLKFSSNEIPNDVKEVVKKALATRELKGKGGSSSAFNMAKYLISNQFIDKARFETIAEYFSKNVSSETLSFSLYGGEASRKWIQEIKNGKRVDNSMKNLNVEKLREKIYAALNIQLRTDYYIWDIYLEPKEVVIEEYIEHEVKYSRLAYDITEDGEVVIDMENIKEVQRCFVNVDDIKDNFLRFTLKDVISVDENGQLISNTHRLSLVDKDEVKKVGELLNSLEKEDNKMEEKEEVKVEETIDNACDEKVEVEIDNVSEAENVEAEEKEEDKAEDIKEEEAEEDFKSKYDALTKEVEELRTCLNSYKQKEEIEKMNALVEEFAYCFKDEEKAELLNHLSEKTFADVEKEVNDKIKAFALANKPTEEKFSTGLEVKSFSYVSAEKAEKATLASINKKYTEKK